MNLRGALGLGRRKASPFSIFKPSGKQNSCIQFKNKETGLFMPAVSLHHYSLFDMAKKACLTRTEARTLLQGWDSPVSGKNGNPPSGGSKAPRPPQRLWSRCAPFPRQPWRLIDKMSIYGIRVVRETMMNILVINGSPRGKKSNTLKLTGAFIGGINSAGNHPVEIITVSQKNIEPCRGCFCCWEKTPGKCIIADDMNGILDKYINADLVVWSFPLYYYSAPSQTKALIDRLLPTNLPDIIARTDGSAEHPQRYDVQNQRHILISTCGFFTIQNNYEGLVKQFEIMFGGRFTKIVCPEGELFRVSQLEERTNEYLAFVTKAGAEYVTRGFISDETQKKLDEPLYPPEQFMEMANLSWEKGGATQETRDGAYRLLRQMAVLYKPHGQDKEIVFEFYFTDLGKTYQLVLEKTKCTFRAESLLPYTVRIETSFDVWAAISDGRLNGQDALFQHKYRVSGDFSAIEYLERCFSGKKNTGDTGEGKPQKRAMGLFLLPWIAFWMAVPLSPDFGVYIALVVTAAMPVFSAIRKLTVYDTLSVFCVVVLSVLTLIDFNLPLLVTFSYGLFGFLWLFSAFTRIPLSAWYSSDKYGGDAAFNNPLFLLTNKIISVGWGGMYMVSCIWVWAIMHSYYYRLAGLMNMVCPLLMGIFTAFFSKHFPAYYARKTK
jgi:multimeric flavodoxin WrbA/putative sterol carrier protein